MEIRKTVIASNIKALSSRFKSLSDFARAAGMAPATLTTFLKHPEERNITLDHLFSIADVSKVELWMLLVENFPFEEVKAGNHIKSISPTGYRLLSLFEPASSEQQKSLLDYVSYQLKDVPGAERKVRETQARYYPPSYQGCNEDHEQ